jgi:hypothetical protein
MSSNHVRLAVMAWNEFTTDVPEHADPTSKVIGTGGPAVSARHGPGPP